MVRIHVLHEVLPFFFFFLSGVIFIEAAEVAVGGAAFRPFSGLSDADISHPTAGVVKAKKSMLVHSCV